MPPTQGDSPMKIDLSGKRAIVTGSTGGIGLAIATGLARAGASVTVVGRSQATVDAALATLRAQGAGGDASGVVADLGTADGCKALVTARLAGQRDERRAPGPPLRPRHARAWLGRIQFVSSESALNIPTGMVHYGVTKS